MVVRTPEDFNSDEPVDLRPFMAKCYGYRIVRCYLYNAPQSDPIISHKFLEPFSFTMVWPVVFCFGARCPDFTICNKEHCIVSRVHRKIRNFAIMTTALPNADPRCTLVLSYKQLRQVVHSIESCLITQSNLEYGAY
jgi:hypothetical protein